MILSPGNYYPNNSPYQDPYTNPSYYKNEPNYNNDNVSPDQPKKRNLLLILIIGIVIILVLVLIALLIIFSLNPCSVTKCHRLASTCINRSPFKAQCICNPGYAGDGKTVCDECGKTHIRPNLMRIVGGTYATPSSWPYTVYIRQEYRGIFKINNVKRMVQISWKCGGTLINHKTVLTAAHCIHKKYEYKNSFDNKFYTLKLKWNRWYPNLESTFKVFVGAHDITNLASAQRYVVKKIIMHHEYDDKNLRNDIAIFKLEDLVRPSKIAQFGCLPSVPSSVYPKPRTEAYIVGWGRIYDKGPESSILKNAKVTVYGKSYCKLVGPKTPKDWNSQICAGSLDGSVDSCQGDSGGGLFIMDNVQLPKTGITNRMFVAGIVSYGEACASKNKPAIYTRVSYWLDWIRKHSDF